MAFLVDDVVEAALGPWGILLGIGVGVALLNREKLAPAAGTAAVAGVGASERARTWVSDLSVTERVQKAAAEVGDWWSDLYAEAQAEWTSGRAASVPAAAAGGTRAAARRPRASARSSKASSTSSKADTSAEKPGESSTRVRGSNGRFVKRSEP